MPAPPPKPPSIELRLEASLEIARRVIGRFHGRHGRLPTQLEMTAALHLMRSVSLKRGELLADPDRQDLVRVLAGREPPEPAAHEAALDSEAEEPGWLRLWRWIDRPVFGGSNGRSPTEREEP